MPSFAKLLGQAAPADTTAATLYTKPTQAIVFIDQLIICNVTGSPATYRVFHDDDGATYAVGNALCYDKSLAANDYILLDIKGNLYTDSGTIGVRSGTGAALTFSLYGEEVYQL